MPIEISPGDQPLEIDDYVVIEEIGRGAMKIVFRATHKQTGNDVALAVLRQRYPNSEHKARFRREAALMQELNHPNIVAIEKSGVFEGQPFLAMEYIDGGSIADQLLAGPASTNEIASWMLAICRAVQYAHDKGLLHRDIKPENIMLGENRVPKIADFGLAKASAQDHQLTRMGQALGTMHYVAPEQLRGEQVTTASDIYSLGVTLFEMLIGRSAFLELTRSREAQVLVTELERKRAEAGVEKLKAFFSVCEKCMKHSPTERFTSAAELSDAIQAAHSLTVLNEPPVAVPAPSAQRQSSETGSSPFASTSRTLSHGKLVRGYTLESKYILEVPLDQGAMGEVWKATAKNRDLKVVVKFLSKDLRNNQTELERFIGSFRLVEALHHESICPLYDLGTDPVAGVFVVMKFLEGITLAQYCQRRRSRGEYFSVPEICRILFPIARALDYSHNYKVVIEGVETKGVVHRDVKPPNIILTEDGGNPILLDFGLAEPVQATVTDRPNPETPAGTYRYIAPEVWAGHTIKAPSDQYALGVVAYEMLSGSPPFLSVPDIQLPHCVQHSHVPSLNGVSEHVNRVLSKVLSKTPSERYLSCSEFIEALRCTEHSVSPANERILELPLRKRNRLIVFGGVAILTLAGFLVWPATPTPDPVPPLPEPVPVPVPKPEETAETVLKRAEELLKNEDFSGAREAVEKALQLNPSLDSAYVLRGVISIHEGLPNDAMADFEKAISLNEQNAMAHLYRANLLQRRKQYVDAIDAYNVTIQIDPSCKEAFWGRGSAELAEGFLGDAIISLSALIQLDSENPDAWETRGSIYQKRERYQDAINDYRESLRLDKERTYLNKRIDECQKQIEKKSGI